MAIGGTAYVLWGLSALYWPLLRPASVTEILAHRIIWSLVVLLVLVSLLRRHERIIARLRRPRDVALLALAAVLTAVNWGVFIYATTRGRVLEASLGDFIAPLVMVVLGVQAFRERPSTPQWTAVGFGAAGVAVLVLAFGQVPWVALTLAGTFGLYGLVKKWARVGAIEGMTIETGLLFVPALAVVVATQLDGTAAFGHLSWSHTALMAGAGLVLLAPMLLFNYAGNRIPLSVLGMLQYLEPIVQFLIGALVFTEAMPGPRWAAFVLVWTAVLVPVADAARTIARSGPRMAERPAEQVIR